MLTSAEAFTYQAYSFTARPKSIYIVDEALHPITRQFLANDEFGMVPTSVDGNPWFWHYSKPNLRAALSSNNDLEGFITQRPLDNRLRKAVEGRYGPLDEPEEIDRGIHIYGFRDKKIAKNYLKAMSLKTTALQCDGYTSE